MGIIYFSEKKEENIGGARKCSKHTQAFSLIKASRPGELTHTHTLTQTDQDIVNGRISTL